MMVNCNEMIRGEVDGKEQFPIKKQIVFWEVYAKIVYVL